MFTCVRMIGNITCNQNNNKNEKNERRVLFCIISTESKWRLLLLQDIYLETPPKKTMFLFIFSVRCLSSAELYLVSKSLYTDPIISHTSLCVLNPSPYTQRLRSLVSSRLFLLSVSRSDHSTHWIFCDFDSQHKNQKHITCVHRLLYSTLCFESYYGKY